MLRLLHLKQCNDSANRYCPTGFKLVSKREFLDVMNLVIPWTGLALIAPHAPAGKTDRPPVSHRGDAAIHLLHQFFGHSDPAMEEALHNISLY